jgi:hypothetical protein
VDELGIHPFRDKLSNSGDTLELQVPSRRINSAGGWSNQSCKVISLKAYENNVSDRGSKSKFIKFVKEQRADDSYINPKIQDLVLRCALRGVRKKDLAGIPF